MHFYCPFLWGKCQEGGHGALGHEDTGEKGYNYRSERFFNRLNRVPIIHKVFNSRIHGDPATPLFKAYAGENITIRLLMPADKPRNISFVLHGHQWRLQTDNPLSDFISVQGGVSVGGAYNIKSDNGASMCPGDYLNTVADWRKLRKRRRKEEQLLQLRKLCQKCDNWKGSLQN